MNVSFTVSKEGYKKGEEKPKRPKLVKGSQEAKDYMAALRAMRQKKADNAT